MKATTNPLILTHDDYQTLNSYVKQRVITKGFDNTNTALLKAELQKATLVNNDELPLDVVRLNSRVTVQEGVKDRLIELILVVPEKANIKERRVSVLAPLGTALLGFRQGEKIKWTVPSGKKTFTIVKVSN
ncbi:MAG: GreA/GreB family elongation factor [Bacteroidota bacterium]